MEAKCYLDSRLNGVVNSASALCDYLEFGWPISYDNHGVLPSTIFAITKMH